MNTLNKIKIIVKKLHFKSNKPPIGSNHQETFDNIYKTNYWKSKESVSGPGSTINATKNLVDKLKKYFEINNIINIYDIPCGDFNWIKNALSEKIEYLGADIVKQITTKNQILFGSKNINFINFDLINDNLKDLHQFYLIIIRDCFVHFSYDDIRMAFKNIITTKSELIMMTTFTEERPNENIITGYWRPLNFMLSPFNFPPPINLIIENSESGQYNDKSLGVWRINDIKKLDFISGKNI
ncbi:MAG: class I SAM-dependent methyltransferase [Saprospiraceae bacterium]|nr:class I SAM-dependent methyltransferase [Saprospiraceae bacterium]